jgi:hypothetical protein
MSEPIDEDVEQRSAAGKRAKGETSCPICGDTVDKVRLPEHIREEHSGDTGFPES